MVPEETLDRAAVDDLSPRYLRKQKPASGKRRRREAEKKPRWRRGLLAFLVVLVACAVVGVALDFLFFSPVMLLHPDGVTIHGARYVTRRQVLDVFDADMGRSVLPIPLDRRLTSLDSIPWVKQAAVERVLPDGLVLQIEERVPVAYVHAQGDMKLIDAQGVVLNRPAGANFNLPVVAGLDPSLPDAERASRMRQFADFLQAIETVRSGATAEVSEADLSNPDDVQVTLAGAPELAGQGPVVIHFGKENFAARYRLFLDDFASWKVRAGNIEQVDLRYDGQALITPANPLMASAVPAALGAAAAPPAPAVQPPAPKPVAAKSIRRPIAGKLRKGRVSQ